VPQAINLFEASMTRKLLWRLASGLTLFFALAHTFGMLHPAHQGPDEDALLAHMRGYHFNMMGSDRTYWEFFFGFGLYLTASLLAVAAISWQMASLKREVAKALKPLGWTLLLAQVAFATLGWTYFFAAPAVTASLAALCTGWAVLKKE
jgi:hypothetical protein